MEEIRQFDTGAVRGSAGKFDFPEYISPFLIFRYAEHMRKNAEKYGAGNWKKGIPRDEYFKSLCRHFFILFFNETTDITLEPESDHLAAMVFNIQGMIEHDDRKKLANSTELYGYPAVSNTNG